MPFFIPSRLIDLEYFKGGSVDYTYEELARDYQREIDLAFFVVNFGFSKADYEVLTPSERLFIVKAHENKVVGDSGLFQKAVEIAFCNANRKKGKRPAMLWPKKQKPLDKEMAKANLKLVEKINEKETDWIEKIYLANGLRKEVKDG